MKLERRKYSERELALLEENVAAAEQDVKVAEGFLRSAKDAHIERSRELIQARKDTEVIEKIESYGLNHRVVQLAEETYVRVNGVESLSNRNRSVRAKFYRLSTFVRQGELPKHYDDATVLDWENMILSWCYGLLDNDFTRTGESLKMAVRQHYSETRERWLAA